MKRIIILATSYPYTAVILAVLWISSAFLLKLDTSLNFDTVIVTNVLTSIIISLIGFRK